jgi:dolichol-phosphate mannosyltransferase
VTDRQEQEAWDADGTGALVALATYNERDNLPSLVDALRRYAPGADVLVIDDASPDGTGEWCREFAREHPWFTWIGRPGKLGLGSALRLAMHAAIDRGYAALVTLDADWSHPPDALPRLLAAAREADVAIGSRYCPGGSVRGWSRTRWIVSRALNCATRATLGLGVRDASTSYRCYRVALLREVDWESLQDDGYAYLEAILALLGERGARFVETPIEFAERRAGASKANLAEAAGKARMLVRLASRRLRR